MAVVAVQDANILLDCAGIEILDLVFAMPYQFKTTDLVWAEITDPTDRNAIELWVSVEKLTIESLDASEIEIIYLRSQAHPGLSLEDCSAWYLAEREHGFLLTGDKKLRNTAQREGLEVRGSLWILKELHRCGAVDSPTACTKIHALSNLNPRLPRREIEEMKAAWCN